MSTQRLRIIKDKAIAMLATFLNKLSIELNYFGLFILYECDEMKPRVILKLIVQMSKII